MLAEIVVAQLGVKSVLVIEVIASVLPLFACAIATVNEAFPEASATTPMIAV